MKEPITAENQLAVDPDLWADKPHRIKLLEEALRYLLGSPEIADDAEVSIYTARVRKTCRNILEMTP